MPEHTQRPGSIDENKVISVTIARDVNLLHSLRTRAISNSHGKTAGAAYDRCHRSSLAVSRDLVGTGNRGVRGSGVMGNGLTLRW